MTNNLQRKIKFAITRYIENIYTIYIPARKIKIIKKKEKKRIKSAINDKKNKNKNKKITKY